MQACRFKEKTSDSGLYDPFGSSAPEKHAEASLHGQTTDKRDHNLLRLAQKCTSSTGGAAHLYSEQALQNQPNELMAAGHCKRCGVQPRIKHAKQSSNSSCVAFSASDPRLLFNDWGRGGRLGIVLEFFHLLAQTLDFSAHGFRVLSSCRGLRCRGVFLVCHFLCLWSGTLLLVEPIALLILWHLDAVLATTTEAEVGTSEAKATELEWEDAHTTRRATAREATGNVATVELLQA